MKRCKVFSEANVEDSEVLVAPGEADQVQAALQKRGLRPGDAETDRRLHRATAREVAQFGQRFLLARKQRQDSWMHSECCSVSV